MATAPSSLTREQRRSLLDVLNRIPAFSSPQGRDALLLDLPPDLVAGITRADAAQVDLFNIVQAVAGAGPLPDGSSALEVVLENALDLSVGSPAGQELQTLRDSLSTAQAATMQATATPPTPDQALSPLDQAVRYRQLKDAADTGNWALVLQLAPGLPDFRDVPDLVTTAQQHLDAAGGLVDEARDAFIAGQWDQVITLAHQAGPNASPDLLDLARHAW